MFRTEEYKSIAEL